ncbi:MAG: DMT family transporter, partial [Rhodospirillales bacterium]
HATWNFFVKRINGGPELIWLFSALSVLIYLPVALAILIIEKPAFGVPEILFTTGSALLHLGYFLLLQTGYRKGDLSLVYPTARATGPFLSTGFAVLFLGETMTLQIALGAITIIAGVICLTGGFRGGTRNLAVSIGFGAGAGMLIGSYTVWDAYAVSILVIPPLLLDYASSLGRVILLAPLAARRRARLKDYWRDHRSGVIAIAIFNPLAYILVLYALTFTPVIYVAPTREISVLLTVLMGSLLLGEGDLRRRLVWAAVILAGTTLLATA